MKKVLVSGATGFIGRHCLPLLADKGYEVHAVTPDQPIPGVVAVIWHQADLLNSREVQKLMAEVRPCHLLHLAWFTVPGEYWNSLENIRWLQASLELLQVFGRHRGQRVVVAGTCAEYDWRYGYCSETITPLNPSTLYGVCKHSLQLVLAALAEKMGFSAAWGRIFFLFGPFEHPARLVPQVISSLLKGGPAECSHGRQVRSFLYVRDLADAFVQLLDSQVTGPVNIDSGQPVALKEIIYQIATQLGHPELIRLGARTPLANEPHLLLADVSRLFQEVGWRPRYSLEEGLEETIQWWRAWFGNRVPR
jgi:nucleoside-diphosphate-sugar epimerase